MDRIEDVEVLRESYGAPSERALKKQLSRLDKHCRDFIARSPFLVIASADGSGGCDASPKGDAPGFVRVIDDTTLLIPDRLGNNRVDMLGNLVARPGIGLIFFVPGINETLHVNGQARITTDHALLEPLAVNGKVPRTMLLSALRPAETAALLRNAGFERFDDLGPHELALYLGGSSPPAPGTPGGHVVHAISTT